MGEFIMSRAKDNRPRTKKNERLKQRSQRVRKQLEAEAANKPGQVSGAAKRKKSQRGNPTNRPTTQAAAPAVQRPRPRPTTDPVVKKPAAVAKPAPAAKKETPVVKKQKSKSASEMAAERRRRSGKLSKGGKAGRGRGMGVALRGGGAVMKI